MPFNVIPPQVQSNHTPSVHCRISNMFFSTIRLVVVHGMFLLSCRIRHIWARVEIDSVFWLTLSLFCSGVVWGRYTGLLVPPDLKKGLPNILPLPTSYQKPSQWCHEPNLFLKTVPHETHAWYSKSMQELQARNPPPKAIRCCHFISCHA